MVRAVVTTEHGGVAVSWVGNTLTVADGADFPRDGGQFIVEGDPTTVYSYSLVTDGETEDDPDVITTVDPAPAGLPDGDQFRLTLWPVAVSSVAEVALPEAVDDTVPAIIPHALKPYLPDGVRDPEAQEAVLIGQRDMAWVVVDILDQPEVVMGELVSTVAEAREEAMLAHGLADSATTTAEDAHNAAVLALDKVQKSAAVVRIDSSRGSLFKQNAVSTVLKVTVMRGDVIAEDIVTLWEHFGPGAYLEWKWQRLNEDTFSTISSADPRIGAGGFTLTLGPDDVDTKTVFRCELNGE